MEESGWAYLILQIQDTASGAAQSVSNAAQGAKDAVVVRSCHKSWTREIVVNIYIQYNLAC